MLANKVGGRSDLDYGPFKVGQFYALPAFRAKAFPVPGSTDTTPSIFLVAGGTFIGLDLDGDFVFVGQARVDGSPNAQWERRTVKFCIRRAEAGDIGVLRADL